MRIQQISQQLLRIEQGSLYPALYRLEQGGLIESEWGVSDNNRRAKFYQLTRKDNRGYEKRQNNGAYSQRQSVVCVRSRRKYKLRAPESPHSITSKAKAPRYGYGRGDALPYRPIPE
ncbi:MAG: helix-turn-helix transcriptional regulator [Bryobacteraceae bacterium]